MKPEEPKENQIKKGKAYWEARQNLFGFFNLLLEVDKRVNPHLYKKMGKADLTPKKNKK